MDEPQAWRFLKRATDGGAAGASSALNARSFTCQQAVNLPAGGVIVLPNGEVVTLTADAAFRPTCTPHTQPAIIAGTGGAADIADLIGGNGISIQDPGDGELSPNFSNFYDPFYASTFPQCYALAATTVVAYTLVIMLLVTPRSFLDGGVVVLGRRGFTNGGSGGTSIGGRPWLQKVAALTVAISLTIASVDTFRVAEYQYSQGIQNARTLQRDVLGGNELKVIRLISSTFLWLAQAQTLIRLFPRQREKVIIKWTAFALITLDVIFDGLNSFLYTSVGSFRPKSFTEAVPALSYLFQLTLGVLYAAWVIYYALMKKQYAFYHPQMRNMCLVAVLSVLSLVIPLVFFVLDIQQPDFAGWGDYVRWVGAAAASVIVWEWVERIEALEREERKGGILGREVFDGDEMLDIAPGKSTWPKRRKDPNEKSDDDGESGGGGSGVVVAGTGSGAAPTTATGIGKLWPDVSALANRYRSRSKPKGPGGGTTVIPPPPRQGDGEPSRFLQPPLWPSRPAPAVTPVSRTDTASADSTVYAVRYHPLTESTSRTTDLRTPPPGQGPQTPPSQGDSSETAHHEPESAGNNGPEGVEETRRTDTSSAKRWKILAQAVPFRRDATASQPQTSQGGSSRAEDRGRPTESAKWDIRSRFEDFAASQAEKLREKMRPTVDTANLPVMVIPAPARRGAALAQVLEEEESSSTQRSRDNSATTESSSTALGTPNPIGGESYASMHPRLGLQVTGPAGTSEPSVTIVPTPSRQQSES